MGGYVFFSDRPLEKYHKSDFLFLLSTILLLGLGIFTLYFASGNTASKMFGDSMYFVKRQLAYVAFGIFLLLFFASVRMQLIKKMLPFIVFLTIMLCLLIHVPGIGIEKNDAVRWIRMPMNFTFQPSELVKFAIVLYLANYFDKEASILNDDEKTLFPCVMMMLFQLLLVAFQKDLSTTAFIFVVCMVMFVASGVRLRWFFLLLPLLLIAFGIFVLSEEYRIERVIGFVRPEEHADTINYQPILSKRAVSTGGFWGTGIGSGLNVSMRVPEVQSDYIFAAWSEAMGLFGVIVYFVLLGVFSWRGYRTAVICKNRFAAYASFGFVSMILLQSLLNCAVVCGALPSTGIPLPFFSLGGSSIVLSLAMCGFIINASRFDTENDIVDENNVVLINSFSGVNVYE
ncbi:MAG: putative peptidoglycan glycosyltransferase FtsW [Treponema sp.]|nr:putative peptidoglycan glycosyltransferase FtsW [Treponema sp.]